MIGADLLVSILKNHGVTFVATLCGNGLNPFLVACQAAGVRLVDTRNEQAASYMADAYARLTGQLAVCAVSSGIAHANALAGVINACYDGAPLLLITGESASPARGRGKFQELDHPALAAPVCKLSKRITHVENLAYEVEEAIAIALAGRPGPVHLSVPLDVLEAAVEPPPTRAPAPRAAYRGAGDPDAVQEALGWIAGAERPLLAVGNGAFHAQAGPALARFLSLTDIPVVTPIWERGIIPRGTPQFLGVIGAASGGPRLLSDTDLLITLGARLDYRLGYGQSPPLPDGARIIRVDIAPEELALGAKPDLALLGDPASVLEGWSEGWTQRGARPHTAWLRETKGRDMRFRARWSAPIPPPPMTGHHLVEALRPFLTDDTLFLVDGGNIGQWAHMCLADGYPETWLTCGASGVVGWGLGGAMGARIAHPDRPIILLTGDGSIGFTLGEVESAVRQGLPYVILLADDQAWGIVVSGQKECYGEDGVLASCLGQVRYDLLAEAMGAVGIRAESPEEVASALQRGLASDKVVLIHAPIRPIGPADQGR